MILVEDRGSPRKTGHLDWPASTIHSRKQQQGVVMKKKTCIKCHQEKSLTDYYAHRRMKDGRLRTCIECEKKQREEYRRLNIDRLRILDRRKVRRWRLTEKGAMSQRAYRRKYPLKYKARNIVSNAIRSGELERGCCSVCGSLNAEAHHPNYAKPLDIIWLCVHHHKECHKKTELPPKGMIG